MRRRGVRGPHIAARSRQLCTSATTCVGRGLGRALYDALLRELAQRGFHCAMGGIALPNAPSVALHERMGFVKVAHFREVGWKLGRWIDVGYWQRSL